MENIYHISIYDYLKIYYFSILLLCDLIEFIFTNTKIANIFILKF